MEDVTLERGIIKKSEAKEYRKLLLIKAVLNSRLQWLVTNKMNSLLPHQSASVSFKSSFLKPLVGLL